MNKLIAALFATWMIFSNVAIADEQRATASIEIRALKIKLSTTRTGIVQKIECKRCDFSIAKITPETKAYVNGKEVDLLRAKSRSGKKATVIVYLDTRVVRMITWAE